MANDTRARDTLTGLLTDLVRGDADAFGQAFEILYDQLRVLAHGHRRRWDGDDTLGTTVLVHEAYLKLVDSDRLAVGGRGHFLSLASRAMRQLLCNHARDRRRLKRGGGLHRADADVDQLSPDVSSADLETLLALDEALERLAAEDERLVRVVECRFFAGLSIPDTAEALGVSSATVKREWARARRLLYEALAAGEVAG